MKQYILVLFFIGIIFTIIGYYESSKSCEKPKIIYKYVDQTIEEAQKGGQPSVYNQFLTLFSDPPILT